MPHIDIVKDSSGRALPSVTQILSVIDKPFVDKWAVKHSTTKAKLLQDILGPDVDLVKEIKGEVLEKLGIERDDFWLNGEELGQRAATRGKNFHKIIEDYYHKIPPTSETEKLYKLLDAYLLEKEFEIAEIEKLVINEQLGYRGTLDVIFRENERYLIVGDWKFTNSIHIEQLLQLAGYGQAYIEGPVKGLIVRIAERKAKPRKESILDFPELGYVIEERKVEDLSVLYPVFNSCLEIWKFLNGTK